MSWMLELKHVSLSCGLPVPIWRYSNGFSLQFLCWKSEPMLLHRVGAKAGNWLLFHVWNYIGLSLNSFSVSDLLISRADICLQTWKCPWLPTFLWGLFLFWLKYSKDYLDVLLSISPVGKYDLVLSNLFWLLCKGSSFLIFCILTESRSIFL